MRDGLLTLIISAAIVFPMSTEAATPPINCKKAHSPVEQTICASPEFIAMDRELAALYDRGMAEFAPDERHNLARSQLLFLKQRSGCAWAAHHSAHPGTAVNECIRDKMEIRLRALRGAADRGGVSGR